MKFYKTKLIFLIIFAILSFSFQIDAIELTKDNLVTLIGTKSKDYTVFGLSLGLKHKTAWEIINTSNLLVGEKDPFNPSRISVYERRADGSKGDCLLNLVWKTSQDILDSIVFFEDSQKFLSPNFRRLLSLESTDDKSKFKRTFIGSSDRSKVTLNVPQKNGSVKHITYYYDKIGLEVTYKNHSGLESVVFAIYQNLP